MTGADRNPTFPAMRSSTLQSIQYPTSGTNEFIFEPNAYAYVGNGLPRPTSLGCASPESATMAGGLRIKEINNTINGVAVKSTEYTYGIGVLRAQPFYHNYFYVTPDKKSIYPNCSQPIPAGPDFKLYAEVNCGPVNDVGYRNGSQYGYEEVTEKVFIGSSGNRTYNGSTVYRYRTEKDASTGPTSDDVMSYIFSDKGMTGDYYEEHPIGNQYVYPYFPGRNLDWSLGQLLTKTVKNGSNQTVFEQVSTYTNDVLTTVPAAKAFIVRPDVDYIYVNYNFIEGWPKLTGQVETTYDVNGQNGVTTIKNFTYTSTKHNYLTNELFTGSDNVLIETEHRYIEDYDAAAMGSVIGTLKEKQILNKEIDTRIKKRGLTVQGSITEYNTDGQPATKYLLETTAPVSVGFSAASTVPSTTLYKKREQYSYSNKRMQTVTKFDGAPVTYLWSYSDMRPVAEIKNATYSDVVNTGENLAVLNSSTPTDISIQTLLKNIRTKLPNALIKGYTHDLIYGVSSSTEPNDLTTSYEYDAYGRLMRIKNNKSQIVKEYAYNTIGRVGGNQQPSCSCCSTDPYIVMGLFTSSTPVVINASSNIETDVTQAVLINATASLTLKAAVSVRLKPGFTIKPGAAFRAYNGPCN